jgi:anti-sigma B factor antagonist
MEYTITPHNRCNVMTLVGRVDGSTAPRVEAGLKDLMAKGTYNIVIDMKEVDFMSSAGWWVLIETQKECKKLSKGEVILVNVKEKIRSSLNLVGMDTYFKMYDDLTEAVGSF